MGKHGYLIRSFFSVLLAGLPLLLAAQIRPVPDTSHKEFIIIDHFGKLIEDREGVESVKLISRGLQLRIDSTYIYADSASIIAEDWIYAYGNVVIQQGDSLHVFTDTLYYTRETDIAQLVGEVTLEQGTRQLWTKNLIYHLDEKYGEYNQGGVLTDKDLQVSSKYGVYYAANEEMIFEDSVVVLHPKFNMAADSMKYLASESKVVFTGPTNIYTPTAKIYCESGFYNLETDIAEFNQHAQYAGDNKKATADTIRYDQYLGEVTMTGHVHVEEPARTINSESLRYLEKTGETWIRGKPAMYSDSTRSIVSPDIFYNEKTNQVTTKGPSEIHDGDLFLKAEQFDFDQATGAGKASGHVIWSDTTNDLGIRSDIINYSKKTESVLAYGSNRPMFFTLIDGDTLYLAADTLHMWSETDTIDRHDTVRMMRAYHDVRLFKSDMQGRMDSLVFNGRDSLFRFFGRPILWSDTTQFSADSISLLLQNKKIRDITLTQKALIVSELFTLYFNQIKGKTILAQFDSSAIKAMWVTGNAESIYYTQDDHAAFIGVNKTICSKMYFVFEKGKIHLLKYYGDNSSSMMPMGEAKHDTLRLDGFQWRAEERPLTLNDILK